MNRPWADHHQHKECEQKHYTEREKHLSGMNKGGKSFSREEMTKEYPILTGFMKLLRRDR